MKPIPRSMLIHAATLENATVDAYQTRTYSTAASLTRVRIEPTSKQVLSNDGTSKQLMALLLYDCRNSLPLSTTFMAGQYVTFGSVRMRVETVESLYDGRKLHHIEVGLSG